MSSFTNLNYHLIFSTKHREPLIRHDWQQRLFDYIGGIVRHCGGHLIAAGGMPDHIHLLASIGKSTTVTDALRDIKSNSSRWVHEEFPNQAGFAWQAGYGAFTVSYSRVDAVREYIANQAEHHRATTFQDEFLALLRRHRIEFDERYIWA